MICPVCSKDKSGKAIQVNAPTRTINYHLCGECGLLFHTKVFLDGYYTGGQYREDEGQADVVSEFDVQQQNIRADILMPYLNYKGRILDVGCSAGVLLERFRDKGCSVTGVEPSITFRAYCGERGLHVLPDIDDVTEKEFSLCTIIHTLEHLQWPVEMLRKIREKARVVCVVVPSLYFDPMSLAYSHPCVFSPESLREALVQAKWSPQVILPIVGYKNVTGQVRDYPVDIIAIAARDKITPVSHVMSSFVMGRKMNTKEKDDKSNG